MPWNNFVTIKPKTRLLVVSSARTKINTYDRGFLVLAGSYMDVGLLKKNIKIDLLQLYL